MPPRRGGPRGLDMPRLRRAAWRSILVATGGAFIGGVAVFGVQHGLTLISARYPPLVQAMQCEAPQHAGGGRACCSAAAAPARLRLGEEDTGVMLPAVPAGAEVTCRLDAPGADYAAWSVSGTRMQFRSGPLDFNGECQSAETFAGQRAEALAVSACQRFTLAEPGLHLITVKVMARGVAALDRGQVAYVARREAPPPPAATRLQAMLLLPARATRGDGARRHQPELRRARADRGDARLQPRRLPAEGGRDLRIRRPSRRPARPMPPPCAPPTSRRSGR